MKFRFHFLFFFILLTSSLVGLAQNSIWGEKGALWRYDVKNLVGPSIYEMSKIRDTVIQGKNCATFQTIEHVFYSGPPPDWKLYYNSSHIKEEHITYTSGDTVFFLNKGKFQILYNFSATIGSSWDLGYDTLEGGFICSLSIVQVLDTGHAMINGTSLKYLKVKMTDPWSAYELDSMIYEKIGGIGYAFPSMAGCLGLMEPPQINFKCYKDDFFPVYSLSLGTDEMWLNDCNVNYWLGENELSLDRQIQLYPNPARDQLFVHYPSSINQLNVDIFSADGQLVESNIRVKSSHSSVSIRHMNPGLYFLKILNEGVFIGVYPFLKE